jgi:hypothetical protein
MVKEFYISKMNQDLKVILLMAIKMHVDPNLKNKYDALPNKIYWKWKYRIIKKIEQIYNNFLIRNRRALFYYQMVVNAATPSISN